MADVRTCELIDRFAVKVTARYGAEHGVISPLGIWVLAALVAPAATGANRAALEAILGTDAADAARRAEELLDAVHPAVAAAVAAWADPAMLNDLHTSWAQQLPAKVETGPVPTQVDADRWATDRTGGIIDRFPLQVTPDLAVVLASALATKISWATPFDDTEVTFDGTFAGTPILASPGGHQRFLAETASAGLVAVHAASSVDGITVVSVIAAPDVPAAQVHAAAAEITALITGAPSTASAVDPFALPLDDGHAWTMTERTAEGFGRSGDQSVVHALLPAWAAESDHDLGTMAELAPVFATLDAMLRPELRPAAFSATQTAKASYTRFGFEAAAVTAIGMYGASMPQKCTYRLRTVEIRFDRPFAVAAFATNSGRNTERGWGTVELGVPAWDGLALFNAWDGLALFNAWVARPGS